MTKRNYKRELLDAIESFEGDPPSNEFERGFHAALRHIESAVRAKLSSTNNGVRGTVAARNARLMETVRQVHRRSAYERVLSRVRYVEEQKEKAAAGERDPLPSWVLEELPHLHFLRDQLETEMREHGYPINGQA